MLSEVLRRALAALGDAEVARLTRERDVARRDRARAVGAAVRWHGVAQIQQARADAQAAIAGQCPNRINPGLGGQLICTLPAGHAGGHRDDNGAEWRPVAYKIKEQ